MGEGRTRLQNLNLSWELLGIYSKCLGCVRCRQSLTVTHGSRGVVFCIGLSTCVPHWPPPSTPKMGSILTPL